MVQHDSIYIVDTETTGLTGYPDDLILEIGIVKLNLKSKAIEIVYDQVVGYPIEELSEYHKQAWIFDHSTLSLERVLHGKPVLDVAKEVQTLLNGNLVAIYNVEYDYDKFLKHKPFNLDCTILPCIMKKSTKPCKVPSPYPNFKYKWPSLNEAQEILLDEHDIPDFVDPHRASSDAYVSTQILLELIANYNYPVNEFI